MIIEPILAASMKAWISLLQRGHQFAGTGGVVVKGKGNDPGGMGYYVVVRTMWEGTPVFTVYGHLQAPSELQNGSTMPTGGLMKKDIRNPLVFLEVIVT